MSPDRGAGGAEVPSAGAGRTGGPQAPARRGAEIRAYPDGPFLVRGPVTIVDGDGRELLVRRRVVALCRCGRSRRQPICDGTHTAAGFSCSGTPTVIGLARTLDLRAEPGAQPGPR